MRQQQNEPKPKATPPRRRQNRRTSTTPARKSYASENDAPTELQFAMEFANGAPSTPLKSASASSQPPSSKPRSRTGNRPRPNDIATSPRQPRQSQHTPPNTSISKTPSAAAYAGATFHASPAPSSLPIPRFFGRNMDSPGVKRSDGSCQEPSPPHTDSETAVPSHALSTSEPAKDESPLDFFFRADKAEKERARCMDNTPEAAAAATATATASSAAAASSTYSPFGRARSPEEVRTTTQASLASLSRRGPTHRTPTAGVFDMELGAATSRSIGPAFSAPYQERIRAARLGGKQGTRSSGASQPQNDASDRGQALKQLLAAGPALPPSPAPGKGQSYSLTSSRQDCAGGTCSPQMRQPNTASSAGQEGDRPPSIALLEANLRQILKLDASPNFPQAPTIANFQGP